jgi:PhzF family phenazine biosynthesis protein
MKVLIYQVDAFTGKVFSGNPAAVCPLEDWLEDRTMQAIAAENNLPETAFFVLDVEGYRIRWFTPQSEVDLCGHATLASAFVLFNYIDKTLSEVTFDSKSGPLTVACEGELLCMDFPSQPAELCPAPREIAKGLGVEPMEVLRSEDYLAVLQGEDEVAKLKPDMGSLKKLDLRGVIATAQGKEVDFVSRFFAPKFGIDEDPVTGSSHCALIPYWSAKLGKQKLHALQVSQRGGELFCEDRGDRVLISGRVVKFMEGFISL